MRFDQKASWPGWKTIKEIGRGSFGAVYEIERDVFGETEKAALKVITIPQSSSDIDELYSEGYDDESITRTFKGYLKNIVAEYSLMRKMNGSANVVNCDDVHYVQHDDGIGWDIYIKMELLTPLTKVVGSTAYDEQVIRIGEDLCKALVLCRKHNIVHRDIKPANIFLSPNGDYKLGDFGIAKTMEKTSGGTKIGTYEYMAPEVYHDEPYGATADIYSLGMVMYWLLNERRLPFNPLPPALPTSSEKEEARKRRFAGEPLPAPVHGSEELKRIVLKACAFDPQDRYQNAQEMLDALRGLDQTVVKEFSDAPVVVLPAEPSKASADHAETIGAFNRKDEEAKTVEPTEKAMKQSGLATSKAIDSDAGTVSAFGWTHEEEKAVEQIEEVAEQNAPASSDTIDSDDGMIGVFGGRQSKESIESPDIGEDKEPSDPAVPSDSDDLSEDQGKEKRKSKPILWIALGLLVLLAIIGFFTIHIWSEATCTTPETCKICGKERTPALGHNWASATCMNPQTCTRCGETRGSVVDHNWAEATCTSPQTCIWCGETRGSALDHSWAKATCTNPQTCTRCGETRGSALDHNWAEATCTSPQTCTRCGETRGNALDHSWAEATCTSPQTCTRCGETRGNALDHSWAEATCTSPQTCTRCGETKGSALGHNWAEATYNSPKICVRCGLKEGVSLHEQLKTANVGDYVQFGRYEQDNNTSNGRENIEWIVLKKSGSKLLLISRYALDCQSYDTSHTGTTWEICALRKWLNESFLENAFSSDEQNMIQSSIVTADMNPEYDTNPGNDTTDKVFLLSIKEVNQYFSSDDARECAPTDYAIAQGVSINIGYLTGGKATCWWWLRSPGFISNYAAFVFYDGFVHCYGNQVAEGDGAVRPALWIDLGP